MTSRLLQQQQQLLGGTYVGNECAEHGSIGHLWQSDKTWKIRGDDEQRALRGTNDSIEDANCSYGFEAEGRNERVFLEAVARTAERTAGDGQQVFRWDPGGVGG